MSRAAGAMADVAAAGGGLDAARLLASSSAPELGAPADADGPGGNGVIRRRFDMSVPRARVLEKASVLRDRSER